GAVDPGAAIKPRDAAFRQHTLFAKLRLAEEHRQWRAVREVLVGRALPALPQRDMGIIEHHGAAARADLRIAVRQHASDKAHIGGKNGVDVWRQYFWDLRHNASMRSVREIQFRGRTENSVLIVRRHPGSFVEALGCKVLQGLDEAGDVGLQAGKVRGLLQRLLIHIERTVDLYLQAVPPDGRSTLLLDDFD